jgi:hypothetical protein
MKIKKRTIDESNKFVSNTGGRDIVCIDDLRMCLNGMEIPRAGNKVLHLGLPPAQHGHLSRRFCK